MIHLSPEIRNYGKMQNMDLASIPRMIHLSPEIRNYGKMQNILV